MNDLTISRSAATCLALDCDVIRDIYRYKKKLFVENPFKSYDETIELIFDHFTKDLGYPLEVVKEGVRMVDNAHKRRKRCYAKISNIVLDNKMVFFGTLTFSPDVLVKTSPETRRRYVARYLKGISTSYLANIDFGDKTDREHYHCVVACESKPSPWIYGHCKFEKVRQEESDCKRLRSYIEKLTNHSLKVEKTGKAKRLIYSRGFVAPCWLLD